MENRTDFDQLKAMIDELAEKIEAIDEWCRKNNLAVGTRLNEHDRRLKSIEDAREKEKQCTIAPK